MPWMKLNMYIYQSEAEVQVVMACYSRNLINREVVKNMYATFDRNVGSLGIGVIMCHSSPPLKWKKVILQISHKSWWLLL